MRYLIDSLLSAVLSKKTQSNIRKQFYKSIVVLVKSKGLYEVKRIVRVNYLTFTICWTYPVQSASNNLCILLSEGIGKSKTKTLKNEVHATQDTSIIKGKESGVKEINNRSGLPSSYKTHSPASHRSLFLLLLIQLQHRSSNLGWSIC